LWEWLKYWLFVSDKFSFEKSHGNQNFRFDLLALVRVFKNRNWIEIWFPHIPNIFSMSTFLSTWDILARLSYGKLDRVGWILIISLFHFQATEPICDRLGWVLISLLQATEQWAHMWQYHWACAMPDLHITFPATDHHRPLARTKLYCLVTEAYVCEQLVQVISSYIKVERLAVEPMTSWSRVRRPNHYTTMPYYVLHHRATIITMIIITKAHHLVLQNHSCHYCPPIWPQSYEAALCSRLQPSEQDIYAHSGSLRKNSYCTSSTPTHTGRCHKRPSCSDNTASLTELQLLLLHNIQYINNVHTFHSIGYQVLVPTTKVLQNSRTFKVFFPITQGQFKALSFCYIFECTYAYSRKKNAVNQKSA